jgi:protein-S-isoprenylcysteine O-methyltransferase Ste14
MSLILRLLTFVTLVFTVFGLALFLPAGTLAWLPAWIFLVLFFGFSVVLFAWLSRHNPPLLQERLRLGASDQQAWDKALFPLIQVLLVGWLVFMALDAVRFHWSKLPAWLQVVGAVLLLGSFYYLFVTFRENSYLSPVVRLQEERGQRVISTGPYRIVRHPMYSAILVFMVGTSLLLGSGYGILVGLLGVGLLARRAVLEEQALMNGLPGYAAYRAKVRYRLIPYLW